MEDTMVIGALVRQTNDALRAAGVQCQTRFVNGRAEARYLIPMRDGRLMAITAHATPDIVVSGKVGKKIKEGLKKVAKSKAFGKILKFGSAIASVVPGGQALGAGLAAASMVQKKVQAAKKKGGKAPSGPQAVPAQKGKALPASAAPRALPATLGELVVLPNGRRARVVFES